MDGPSYIPTYIYKLTDQKSPFNSMEKYSIQQKKTMNEILLSKQPVKSPDITIVTDRTWEEEMK